MVKVFFPSVLITFYNYDFFIFLRVFYVFDLIRSVSSALFDLDPKIYLRFGFYEENNKSVPRCNLINKMLKTF